MTTPAGRAPARTLDLAALTPVAELRGATPRESRLLRDLAQRARAYLSHFTWCGGIVREYFGLGVGGVVGVFLFQLRPVSIDEDWLWVISGDLPPAYLVPDHAPTAAAALEGYCELMEDWIAAVLTGEGLEEAFPVAAAPTEANALALATRIGFLRREIVEVEPG